MRWWDIAAVLPLEHELFGAEACSARSYWSELAQRDTRHYVVLDDPAGGLAAYGGLGAPLLQALLAESDARGVTSCLLEVRVDNPVARRLLRTARLRPGRDPHGLLPAQQHRRRRHAAPRALRLAVIHAGAITV
ncbi:MAG: hypothetical protein ACR2F6_17075 [Mycobacteriales bacterium]